MNPSTSASTQNASFGFVNPQTAPSTKTTPKNAWTNFQPPDRSATSMNSVIAAIENTTPSRTPTVVTDVSVKRNTTRETINQTIPDTMNTHHQCPASRTCA